jgi:hypothetical protein
MTTSVASWPCLHPDDGNSPRPENLNVILEAVFIVPFTVADNGYPNLGPFHRGWTFMLGADITVTEMKVFQDSSSPNQYILQIRDTDAAQTVLAETNPFAITNVGATWYTAPLISPVNLNALAQYTVTVYGSLSTFNYRYSRIESSFDETSLFGQDRLVRFISRYHCTGDAVRYGSCGVTFEAFTNLYGVDIGYTTRGGELFSNVMSV